MSFFSVVLVICVVLASANARPNIIFIFVDDWGWNDVGYHGSSIATPTIDRLASNGLKLEHHYVAPSCSPSRASLLTGRYPSNIGMQHSTVAPGHPYGVPLDEMFFTQELQMAGYSTHIIGKWHLGFVAWEYTPRFRGFDTFAGYYNGAEDYWDHYRSVGDITGYDLRRNEEIVTDANGTYGTYWQSNEFEHLINDEIMSVDNDTKPFFIYLSWQASHNPQQAPRDYIKMYKHVTPASRKFFCAQSHVLDEEMQKVEILLKDNGLWENTLIIFASDNGGKADNGDNAPLRGVKATLWEGGVRVPAFVTGGYLPEERRGVVSDALVHVSDWYPTILKYAGIDSPQKQHLDGFDLSSVIQNGHQTERAEVLINVDLTLCRREVCGAIRYQNYKLLWAENAVSTNKGSTDGCFWIRDYWNSSYDTDTTNICGDIPSNVSLDECPCYYQPCLFDLSNDPCEYYDIKDEEPEMYELLLEKLVTYYNAQKYPLESLYDVNYNDSNPELFDGYWTPWMTYEEVMQLEEDVRQALRDGLVTQNLTKKDNIRSSTGNQTSSSYGPVNNVWFYVMFIAMLACMVLLVFRRNAKERVEKRRIIVLSGDVEKEDLVSYYGSF